jgi:alkaline phosphatase
MITDFLAFDDAVKVACDFADQDGHTLVMAYPDHNTGGMKVGHYYTQMGYTATTVEDLVGPLQGMTMTSVGVERKLGGDYSPANIKDTVKQYWGLDLTDDDVNEILNYQLSGSFNYALANVVSTNHTVFGWTTHGHNGETVPLWMHGDVAPAGIIDNCELAEIAADYIGVNLNSVTDDLYVDVSTVTSDYEIDNSDPENPVLLIGGAEIPISKDYMMYKGKTIQLPGVTVHAPATDKVYVSEEALSQLGLI